jgi:hypothetical protein
MHRERGQHGSVTNLLSCAFEKKRGRLPVLYNLP